MFLRGFFRGEVGKRREICSRGDLLTYRYRVSSQVTQVQRISTVYI